MFPEALKLDGSHPKMDFEQMDIGTIKRGFSIDWIYDSFSVHRLASHDIALFLTAQRWRWSYATHFFRTVTRLGNATSWATLTFVLMISAGQAFYYGIIIGCSTSIAALVSQIIKRLWRRPRPSACIKGFQALMDDPDAFSFPSGHTAAAVAVAIALTGLGGLIPLVAWGFALAVGISRIYLGAHYPFDVSAGALLGMLSGFATRMIFGY